MPGPKLAQIGTIATKDRNRRFRREATRNLCTVRWLGRPGQRRTARHLLDLVAAGGDPLLMAEAECPEIPLEGGLISLPER